MTGSRFHLQRAFPNNDMHLANARVGLSAQCSMPAAPAGQSVSQSVKSASLKILAPSALDTLTQRSDKLGVAGVHKQLNHHAHMVAAVMATRVMLPATHSWEQ
jgi:hypothetical protein